jgi:ribulose kinase
MPSVSPLYNAKLQSSLNLNTQPLAGTNPAKRFILKNIGAANRVVDVSDMSRLLKFSGSRTITLNNNITGVVAGDTFTLGTDSSAMFFAGTATLLNYFSGSYFENIIQCVYVGSNTWIIINAN